MTSSALRPGLKADYWRRGYCSLEVTPVEVIQMAKMSHGLQMWKVKMLDPDPKTRRSVLVVSSGSLHVPEAES